MNNSGNVTFDCVHQGDSIIDSHVLPDGLKTGYDPITILWEEDIVTLSNMRYEEHEALIMEVNDTLKRGIVYGGSRSKSVNCKKPYVNPERLHLSKQQKKKIRRNVTEMKLVNQRQGFAVATMYRPHG